MKKPNTQRKLQFKKGQLVFDLKNKRKGKFVSYNRDMGKTATVEFIVDFNKETGERTTKLEKVNVENLSFYNKQKHKKVKKYNPNEMYYMVRKFHKAFGHHVENKPTELSEEVAVNRSVWTGEELIELLYATANGNEEKFEELFTQFLSGLHKAYDKMKTQKKPVENKLVAQADALTDTLYFTMGSFVEMGVKPFNLFKIVQEANMGKLWEDGKPRYREEDGKIAKPPHWEDKFAPEPRLKAEIERQKQS